ncbi:MAG: TatD family hydrolase [Bdellovibrionales bacterium]|nr:TatD family hydrolase [Bdellovibrionales bacterium]
MQWIDVHTHINMLEMTPEQALASAAEQQVNHMITIGTCPDDLPVVLALAQKFYPQVGCTLGIHPHEAELYSAEIEKFIRAHATAKEVVAIGETGLDYYYNNAPKEQQIHAFRAQLQIAQDLGLPVEIHTRDAEPDTMTILRDFQGGKRGLLHCFTGTWEMAKVGLDCGYDISISGVVTFKNAQALRDVVKQVPLDRLHIETDAPFLAPIPHRGKKNQPAFVTHTAALVADLKGVTLETLSAQLRKNAQALFPKMAFQ